jgi:hypothetical protein
VVGTPRSLKQTLDDASSSRLRFLPVIAVSAPLAIVTTSPATGAPSVELLLSAVTRRSCAGAGAGAVGGSELVLRVAVLEALAGDSKDGLLLLVVSNVLEEGARVPDLTVSSLPFLKSLSILRIPYIT